MKVLLYDTYGGPEVLHIAERPTPEFGPLDVLVHVHAATVGVGDFKSRRGLLSLIETASLIQGGICAYTCLVEAGAVKRGRVILQVV